ncbi:MAG: polynucleotide adenylyltransferase PcnB [Methylophilaceae bacterium]
MTSSPANKKISNQYSLINKSIPSYVLEVIRKLQQYDFQAYMVGGCIRDLLLNIQPKDFDIATNAHPDQVTAIFKNSRIIGRRFKIVHVRIDRQIIEVSTFRKKPSEVNKLRNGVVQDNAFGTIEEDAQRRDFTMNAIFYDPINNHLFDPFNGKKDIENRNINFIGNPEQRINEDPVRLLRAIRFHAKLEFNLGITLGKIKKFIPLLDNIPYSRIFDEMMKFFLTGHAKKSIFVLKEYQLLDLFFPFLSNHSLDKNSLLIHGMNNTDSRVKADKTVNPGFLMAVILWDAFNHSLKNNDSKLTLDTQIKHFFNKTDPNIFIHNRFIKYISEIWRLQPRFTKLKTRSVYRLSNHPRFRAAYDFLLLRCSSDQEEKRYGEWWTKWQEASEASRKKLLITKE